MTMWTIAGAMVGHFRAKRKRNWSLDKISTFMETLCTNDIPIDMAPPPSARAMERAAAAEAEDAAEQAAAENSMAELFNQVPQPPRGSQRGSPRGSPRGSSRGSSRGQSREQSSEQSRGEPIAEEPALEEEEEEEEGGHDEDALDIFEQLAPAKRTESGGNVLFGTRLVMGNAADDLAIGIRGGSIEVRKS